MGPLAGQQMSFGPTCYGGLVYSRGSGVFSQAQERALVASGDPSTCLSVPHLGVPGEPPHPSSLWFFQDVQPRFQGK